ncbi:ATP-binding cassette domain-containing protein [Sinorhizobium medicae]|uniref:ABC transporter ATP-binding protein n=1 Tax=Sinorhizobium medicae TaxID=110321 RepID=UPI001294B61D|nr:ABC transporter ATP-binding protein [Sinorhizobium medicae]MDX1010190.1 ATP-binding cassette domain-containing protein [Sinorhizobium medicae]MDX1052877.1 ATP-binding cassette domain-containing protein [Sinorhizobium medicae]MDX1218779.1 ATP-binding cassette domain-containing protein [Sinorhizobium medicae]MQV99181.1 ATP-binding cassette domain-containing protein [Sinorhizobium medicae]
MTEALFEIEGLSIDSTRGGARRRIVDNVTLSVEPGELYGLVGESGSGKSISMMASVGLAAAGLDVIGGEVRFSNRRRPAREQRGLRGNLSHGVSLLFQNAKGALSPFLTVARQVERALVSAGFRGHRTSELNELFRVVGLNLRDVGGKYPHQISGGQAQRVAMACALATRPALLIADEPTTALDVTTERELLRFLAETCARREMAIVLVAHNLSLVSEYCRRLSILHAGQVVESGDLGKIFASPLHPYTQGLIAAVPDVDEPRELMPLSGSVWGGPEGIDRCRFSHRCSFVTPTCEQRRPAAIFRDGRDVHCMLYEEIPS